MWSEIYEYCVLVFPVKTSLLYIFYYLSSLIVSFWLIFFWLVLQQWQKFQSRKKFHYSGFCRKTTKTSPFQINMFHHFYWQLFASCTLWFYSPHSWLYLCCDSLYFSLYFINSLYFSPSFASKGLDHSSILNSRY